MTGDIAAFLAALPTSIDVGRSKVTAFGHASAIGFGLVTLCSRQSSADQGRQAPWWTSAAVVTPVRFGDTDRQY
jgi:hypothetical protein